MKIDGVQANQPAKDKGTDKDKKFSAVLEKKKQSSSQEPAADDATAKSFSGTPGLLPPPEMSGGPVAKTEQPQAATAARMLDKLTDEITVATKESGVKEVQIQLNSKTLEGLKINISKPDAGGIQVQFQTQSNGIATMLQGQTSQLADRLAAKGLTVASISVNRKPGALRAEGTRSDVDPATQTSWAESQKRQRDR